MNLHFFCSFSSFLKNLFKKTHFHFFILALPEESGCRGRLGGSRGVFGFRFRVAASPVAGLVPPSLDMGHRTFSCLTKAYVPMLGSRGRTHGLAT